MNNHYTLDLSVLQSPCVKGLYTSWWYYQELMKLLGPRAQRKEVRPLGVWPWRGWSDPSHPPLCWTLGGEQFPPSHSSTMMHCFDLGTKARGPVKHKIKPLKPWSKIKLSSVNLIILSILSQHLKTDKYTLLYMLSIFDGNIIMQYINLVKLKVPVSNWIEFTSTKYFI